MLQKVFPKWRYIVPMAVAGLALVTIRSTISVIVKVAVDAYGNVVEATLDYPGPSKYFARLALEAVPK